MNPRRGRRLRTQKKAMKINTSGQGARLAVVDAQQFIADHHWRRPGPAFLGSSDKPRTPGS
jgi:hypothetical protein